MHCQWLDTSPTITELNGANVLPPLFMVTSIAPSKMPQTCNSRSMPNSQVEPTLWLVGRPRRRSSLSIEGRSSWMRLMVCSISMAHAAGRASAAEPPTASAAAKHRIGRTRLPPARREYLQHRNRGCSSLHSSCATMPVLSIGD